jgi:two-component system cell cycle response regulator DivK
MPAFHEGVVTMSQTILYIEDNPDNMALVERATESLGCLFLWAPNGVAGLEMVETFHPDLILLDINLPDIDGYEIARRLRAQGRGGNGHGFLCDVPIIAVTANALKGDAEKALAAGCNAYIPKPINTRDLRKQLAAVLARGQAPSA